MSESQSKRLAARICGIWFVGLTALLFSVGVFAAWASIAPLSSAAIAPGVVSPDSSRKTVQHLEGGIISSINVKEGEAVTRGQVLMSLERTQAEANFEARNEQWLRLQVMRARLQALATGQAEIVLGAEIESYANPAFQQFVKTQTDAFNLRLQLVEERIAVYNKQIGQVEEEIASISAQSGGLIQQVELLEIEIADKKVLAQKGLIRKPEIYPLERKVFELRSEALANDSKITRARQKIEEIQLAKGSLSTEQLDEVAQELTKVNAEIAQTEEIMNASKDVLTRTDILSPVDGTVINIRFKTEGGVVRAGEPILDVVPAHDDLIIDARLSPTDVDNVTLGMASQVQLSAFMSRHMPMLTGELIHIGADVQTDPDTRERFYSIKVRVDMQSAGPAYEGKQLHAGMPAVAFVITGLHTPVEYFLDPVMRSFRRAFREETAL